MSTPLVHPTQPEESQGSAQIEHLGARVAFLGGQNFSRCAAEIMGQLLCVNLSVCNVKCLDM